MLVRADRGTFWEEVQLLALTGDGPQNVRDEDLHQALVQHVVTALGPLQHGLELGEEHQTSSGQPLLRLVMPVGATVQSRAVTPHVGSPLPSPGDSHGQRWCLVRLAKVISPEGLPQCFHQRELEIYHDIHNGLQG